MKILNFIVQENAHSADPMFHKMSQAFDEGGAKGMLMSNLVRIWFWLSYFYDSDCCWSVDMDTRCVIFHHMIMIY